MGIAQAEVCELYQIVEFTTWEGEVKSKSDDGGLWEVTLVYWYLTSQEGINGWGAGRDAKAHFGATTGPAEAEGLATQGVEKVGSGWEVLFLVKACQ